MKNAKVFLKVLIINTLIISLLIILLEIFLGGWFKDNSWGNTIRSERLKEQNYKIKFNDQTYDFIYKKNSLGFRGEEISPQDLEVILIGGSTVNERFTPLELTISGQLNKKLQEDNLNIKIYNGGIDGQSTVGHIVNFKKWFPNIPNFKPKIIIYYIGINERFYYEFNPNPKNFYTENFNTPHDFERMERNDTKGKINDYIKNNSFLISKLKILKFKYFNNKIRSNDYSEFTTTFPEIFEAQYNVNSLVEGEFMTQEKADNFFDLELIKKNDKNNYAKSLRERLKYLNEFTIKMGATPIFINQVMYNGQGVEIMYYTNYIIREYFEKNKDIIFIDLAKKIRLEIEDYYDEFHTKPTGSKKIADIIYPYLKNHLKNILKNEKLTYEK